MTVSKGDWQEFSSGPETFEIRVLPGTERTQGLSFILFNDIQDMFPGVTRLLNGKRMVGMMADAEGNRLLPLRIEYQPGCIIQVVTQNTPTPSPLPSPAPSPLPSPALHPKIPTRTSSQQPTPSTSPTSTTTTQNDSSKTGELLRRASVLEAPNIPASVKEEFRTSVNLYESFVQAVRSGQTEDTNVIRNDFRTHFTALEGEMAKNADLQQQMFEMQQSMVQMQQQALDRLAVIQSRFQAILVQNYELHEYPIPRLFIVLPKDPTRWEPSRLVQNKFRLFFLCECGEHTRSSHNNSSMNLNGNMQQHHIHLAKHEGYDIETPTEFFRRYGSYVLDMLNMLKYGAMIAGLTVPALVPLRMTATVDQLKDTLNHFSYNIEPSVNQTINYLQSLSTAQNPRKGALAQNTDKGRNYIDGLEALEGADLRRLGMFLKSRDSLQVLGNLYRVVTSEGHVKWVCLDHYRSSYNTAAMKELTDLVQVNGGSFEEHTGKVEISLSSIIIAGQFYRAMERGRFIQELKVALTWETTVNDLKALRDAVHRSNLLYLDLSCTNAPSMTAMLGRTKVSNPLWELMINAKLHTFILSAYKGFFSDTSFSARMTDLRRLKISDQLNWKKDGPRLLELIRHSPMLLDLSIECNDLPEAYKAITNAFGITSALEKLSLQSGPQNRILVRHEKGSVTSPGAVDLWVSDPTSPLLASMTNLCSLQIRTELHIPIGKHLSTLTTIMLKNPSLRELWIRCQLSELCEVFETVRAVAATMGTMTSLKLLRAYRSHIQLFTSNLQDGTATILELLSSEPNPTLLPPLLKGYGNRLTKVKISNGNLSAPFWTGPAVDQLLLQGDVSRIQHIELECSSLTEPMCRALLCVLNHPSFPSAPIHFSIKVDIDPKKSNFCERMAKFIVDCFRWLTEVLVEVQELERWKGAFLATGKKPVLQESIIKTYDNWQAVRMARKLHENVYLPI
ncbi:hypothetical protein BKA57DRAFT_530679 [Linnemannia elongata]|nr:hypothetical protein BKA57DRAFT_530679 [Linnemannia elongata]